MAITKEQKIAIVGELEGIVKDAVSCTFVEFDKLGADETTTLREELRKEDVLYKVVKKTLLRRTLEASTITGTIPEMKGNIALAYGLSDSTASARGIHAFAKNNKVGLVIAGGVFEGSFMDATSMQEIATIPSITVLRGMFVNVISSPIQGLVVALSAIAEKREA